jgi:hypothetical protein
MKNSEQNSSGQYLDGDRDEISLTDLISRLSQWINQHYKGLRLLTMCLAAFVLLITAFYSITKPPLMTYSMILSITFPQAEKNQYPNQSPFSLTDIVTRNVIEQVWKKNDLEKQNISLKDLTNSISITQYADNANFIRTRYQAMLSRKNLSQTEISALEKDYKAELDSASRKQALISLTTPFSSALSGTLAKKVLADIPRVWSAQSINDLGVVSIPNIGSENVNDSNFKRYTPFQMTDYFYKSIDNLEQTLATIEGFPGGKTLRDPKTGRTVEDLKKQLREINRFWILDFDNYAQINFKPNEIELRSAEIQLKELKILQNELLAQASIYKKSLNDYDALKDQKDSSNYSGAESRTGQSNGLQLQGDAVQRLINLGSQNKDAEFRQELTIKRVNAEIKSTALEMEISRLVRRINSNDSAAVKDQSANNKIESFAQEVLTQLQTVSESIKRIQSVQMNKFTDDDGLLYIGSDISKSPASNLTKWVAIPSALLVMILAIWLMLLGFKSFGLPTKNQQR